MLFTSLGAVTVDTALKVLAGESVPEDIPAPVFGIDTATAKAILAGDTSAVPEALASEVSERVKAASSGCA